MIEKVKLWVGSDAQPIIDALARLQLDLGTLRAGQLFYNAPDEARLLCVVVGDEAAVQQLRIDLGRELVDEDDATQQLASHVALITLRNGVLVVFRDIVAVVA